MDLRTSFLTIARYLHQANVAVCLVLMGVLFVAQIVVVILRYSFGVGFLELQDVVAYSFAMFVVLGIPVVLRIDRHVRVDIFRSSQGESRRRLFDRIAIGLFLFPVFAMTLYVVMPQIVYSWGIREGGIETGGLPGYFLVKTALPVACALILIQGLAIVIGGYGKTDGGPGSDRPADRGPDHGV